MEQSFWILVLVMGHLYCSGVNLQTIVYTFNNVNQQSNTVPSTSGNSMAQTDETLVVMDSFDSGSGGSTFITNVSLVDHHQQKSTSLNPIETSTNFWFHDNFTTQHGPRQKNDTIYPKHIQLLSKLMNFTNLKELNNSYNYIDNFGYLSVAKRYLIQSKRRKSLVKRSVGSKNDLLLKLFQLSLRLYQRFIGIPVTGKLDRTTLEKIKQPRCGNRDLGTETKHVLKWLRSHHKLRRSKRFVLAGSRWKGQVDYCISKFPKRAVKPNTLRLIRREIGHAFDLWSRYLPFKLAATPCLNRKGGQFRWAVVDVRFERGEHGDGDPFDGPGKVLAHAYFPKFGGDVHLDESERWTNTEKGTNLFVVSLHEIGHSLGLDHSKVPGSIMAPIYPPYRPNISLAEDDINAIRLLYSNLN